MTGQLLAFSYLLWFGQVIGLPRTKPIAAKLALNLSFYQEKLITNAPIAIFFTMAGKALWDKPNGAD